MTSIQTAVSELGLCEPDKDQKPALSAPASSQAALEKGNVALVKSPTSSVNNIQPNCVVALHS